MGSRIASQLANAQIPSLLLDIVLPGGKTRDQAARSGLDAALKGRPGAFFTPAGARLITTGNFEDDMAKIKDCDWIIEAVTENLAVKLALYDKVMEHRAPGTVVSTNTSGIPLASIAEGYTDEFREHFLGTHFFNPPRYLHLCEVIPGPATRPEILTLIAEFCDRHLGKGVLRRGAFDGVYGCGASEFIARAPWGGLAQQCPQRIENVRRAAKGDAMGGHGGVYSNRRAACVTNVQLVRPKMTCCRTGLITDGMSSEGRAPFRKSTLCFS